jgi:hypothetical protein
MGTEQLDCFKLPEKEPEAIPEITACDIFGGQPPNIVIASHGGVVTASSLVASGWSGQIVHIFGEFRIDKNFTITNCALKMGPGARISIQPAQPSISVLATVTNSYAFACEEMWRGFEVKTFGALRMSNSYVSDAQYAVNVFQKSALFLEGNTFDRNWVGLFTSTNNSSFTFPTFKKNTYNHTSALNSPYPGQMPVPDGSRSFAGLWLQNVSSVNLSTNSVSDLNVFKNLNVGIINFSNLTVNHNCRFENMVAEGILNGVESGIGINNRNRLDFTGLGEPANSTTTFNRCFAGVHIQAATWTRVRQSKFAANTRGVWLAKSLNAKTFVWDNYFDISLEGSAGIFLSSIADNPFLEVVGNTFEQTGAQSYGIEITGEAITPSKINISNAFNGGANVFNLNGPQYGIYAENVFSQAMSEFEVVGNKINVLTNGIGVIYDHVGGFSIKDNIIRGNLATSIQAKGVGINEHSGIIAVLEHNCFQQDFSHALRPQGTCTEFDIKCNNFTGTQIPIQLSSSDEIDEQIHRGNFFDGNQEAINGGFDADLEAFKINSNQLSSFRPQVVSSPVPWFIEEPNVFITECAPTDCGPAASLQSPPSSVIAAISTLDTKIADGTINASNKTPVMLWNLQRNLFRKLKDNPGLVTGSVLQSFYSQNATGIIGQFTNVEDAIRDMLTPDATLLASYESKQTDIENLMSSILALEQGPNPSDPNVLAQIEAMQADIANLNAGIDNIQASILSQIQGDVPGIQALNNAISPTNTFQSNEKTVNAVLLEFIANGTGELTPTQLTTLQGIAAQCPKTGGRAVIRAAGMLPLCENREMRATWLNCSGPQLGSEGDSQKLKMGNQVGTLRVFPNPASDALTIVLPNDFTEGADIVLFNQFGQALLVSKSTAGNAQFELSLKNIPNGVYFLKVMDLKGQTLSSKVTINH